MTADIIPFPRRPRPRTRIILADGTAIDFRQAQDRSAQFAVTVSGWLWDAYEGRPRPSPDDVAAAVVRCFPGARMVDLTAPVQPVQLELQL